MHKIQPLRIRPIGPIASASVITDTVHVYDGCMQDRKVDDFQLYFVQKVFACEKLETLFLFNHTRKGPLSRIGTDTLLLNGPLKTIFIQA